MTKKFLHGIMLMLAVVSCCQIADAVPAKPGLMHVACADGTILDVHKCGDENNHYYLSEDGFLLIEDNGIFYYGNADNSGQLVKSDIKAMPALQRCVAARDYLAGVDMNRVGEALDRMASESPRRRSLTARMQQKSPSKSPATGDEGYPAGPGLFPGTSFPSKGDQKAIVILVEYTDVKFKIDNPLDYFSRMLNEDGFGDYGGTGCAAEYFRECSGNLFRPAFDVLGPVTLSKTRSYYGGNDWFGNDKHPEEMVVEAVQMLDDTVDFSEYDRDNDGYVDNIFIFYAGVGEASSSVSESVWPHSWELSAAGAHLEADGKIVDRYGCSNEWEGSRPDGVGTFIHEFSHVIGLPDLYATSYTGAFTPGSWSALDYGPYNNGGMTPPLYGAFERYALGWIAPAVISGPMNAALPPIGSNIAGIIPTSKENEFFLLENRQQTGWDKYIPGHGMLIWHIDYNASQWNSNTVNNSSSHQYADIEEADDTRNEYTRDGDAFPGTQNVTSFTDSTSPSMQTWSRQSLGLPITDIAESVEGLITFKVCGGGDEIAPAVALEPEEIEDESFVALWEAAAGMKYLLTVWDEDMDTGARTVLSRYNGINVGATGRHEVTGLEASHKYVYSVCAVHGLQTSRPSNEIEVFTGEATLRRYAVEALGATKVTSDSFTAEWNPLELANDYRLTVYYEDYAPIEVTEDFTGGFNALPEGWTSSSRSGYQNEPYSGESMPSLRLGDSGDYLKIAYEDGIHGLRFWHRGNSTAEGDLIKVYARTADGSRSTIQELPVQKTAGGVITEIDGLPENTVTVELTFVRSTNRGSLAIDDVTVSHGADITDIVLDDYNAVATGNVTSYLVSGLKPEQEYFYTVVATDGRLFSRASQPISVTTLDDEGNAVGSVASDDVSVSVSGRTIEVNGEGWIMIADVTGRVIATGSGILNATMTAPGVYIVNTNSGTRKVFVK